MAVSQFTFLSQLCLLFLNLKNLLRFFRKDQGSGLQEGIFTVSAVLPHLPLDSTVNLWGSAHFDWKISKKETWDREEVEKSWEEEGITKWERRLKRKYQIFCIYWKSVPKPLMALFPENTGIFRYVLCTYNIHTCCTSSSRNEAIVHAGYLAQTFCCYTCCMTAPSHGVLTITMPLRIHSAKNTASSSGTAEQFPHSDICYLLILVYAVFPYIRKVVM